MDYQYFGAGAPQSYPFLGLPPTPAHTGSANSDDYNNSSPDTYDQFQGFDSYNQYSANGLPKPPTPVTQLEQPVSNGINGFDMILDPNDDQVRRGSNSDDDENMTPAQSRRKAQNRAAQRAFRERKERHVKDLEAKLANMEKSSATVVEENERLKLQLQKAATENEILRATSNHASRAGTTPLPNAGPMRYSPTDFYSEVLNPHENKFVSHRIVTSAETGERLLAVGATWDFIIKHPMYQSGLVDVGKVSDKLKGLAKCDGQGPVFEERVIIEAIESSAASGSDELL